MFESRLDCLSNCTYQAYPSCGYYSTGWGCRCYVGYDWTTLCNTTIFDRNASMKSAFEAYAVVGLLVTLFGLCMLVYDIYLQLAVHHKDWRNAGFLGKVNMIIFAICRVYHFSIFGMMVWTNKPPSTLIFIMANEVVLWIGDVLGILSFMICTVMWIELVLSLKLSSMSKQYKIYRNFFIVLSLVFSPGGLVFAGLVALDNRVSNILMMLWVGVTLIGTALFCFNEVYKMNFQLKKHGEFQLKPMMKRKNYLLGFLALLMILCAIYLVAYFLTFDGLAYDPNYTIIPNYIIRTLETIVFYSYIAFFQQYLWKQPKSSSTSSEPLSY
eukprot:TRINITY_DN16682_c0_g1_i1.p1 TRINITY_DN16682_c0_g1~~TRINITY_DN16682_c0_g1_i1.p1  ORF type:complete len:326 (+),score=62.36 TRINITY_DN16682_c0_g1_i1:85-1062(+)